MSSFPMMLPDFDSQNSAVSTPNAVNAMFPMSPPAIIASSRKHSIILPSRRESVKELPTPNVVKAVIATPKFNDLKFDFASPMSKTKLQKASTITPVLATITSFPENDRIVYRASEVVSSTVKADEHTVKINAAEHSDQIVRSLTADQLKAVAGAYEKVRWTNDVQSGCLKWIESNPTATEDQIRAVKALVNPKHWEHSKTIVDNISAIVRKLVSSPLFGEDSKKKRARSITRRRSSLTKDEKRACKATELVTLPHRV